MKAVHRHLHIITHCAQVFTYMHTLMYVDTYITHPAAVTKNFLLSNYVQGLSLRVPQKSPSFS